MKTMIAIPCISMIHTRFVATLMQMKHTGSILTNFKVGSMVYDSRNLIAVDAIEQGADRILWVDSDMLIPDDALIRLSQDMDETGAEFVSALAFRRRMPTGPVICSRMDEPTLDKKGIPHGNIVSYDDYPRDSFFEIAGSGFGMVLTTTNLVKNVWDKFGPPFTPYIWAGEDYSFCHRVSQLGVKMYCDSRVKPGHVGEFDYCERVYLQQKESSKHDG